MKKFRLLAHTADIGLTAYGGALEGAFANAAFGMFSIMTDLREVRATEKRRIDVSAGDIESLLFEWLNRLLYFFDVEGLLFKKFDIIELSDNKLVADCSGEKFDPSRHLIKIGVKSATYHMLEVDKSKNTVQVIFDI